MIKKFRWGPRKRLWNTTRTYFTRSKECERKILPT